MDREGKFPMPFRSRSALDASKVFCLKKKRKESRESKSRVCCLIDALNCRSFFFVSTTLNICPLVSSQKGIRLANRKKKYKIAGINILTQFYVNFIEGGID